MSIASLPAALLIALQPPIITPIPSAPAQDPSQRPTEILDVRISADRTLLWEGSLRVGPFGASMSQSRSEASPATCGDDGSRAGNMEANSLRISLRPLSTRGEPGYHVDVNWSRPGSPDGCPSGGSRRVQLEQRVSIAPGQEATLRGDGDLTIRIGRRANP